MEKYHIDTAKCEKGKQLLTCTPPPMYANVASVKFSTGVRSGWLYCVEVLGFHEFYRAEEDLHDKLVEMKEEDEEYLERLHIDDFDGLDLEPYIEDYGPENPDDSRASLVSYAVLLSESWEEDDVRKTIGLGIGRYSDEIDWTGTAPSELD